MLTKKEVLQIREHLDRAQNPVFFFDNDPDGLCSFLLLQRYIGRGKGVPIRSFPGMSVDYFRKVGELNADYIFILDKPVVSKEFFDEVEKVNIPVVWIDHHKIDKKTVPKFVSYYNSALGKARKCEPVTYLCQKITNKKEDLWLGVVGCISDRFVPDFYNKFTKSYPDLSINSKEAFEILYKSQIGIIIRMFCFALKDKTTSVMQMIRFLISVKTPYEVLEESSKNRDMHIRFKQISKKSEKFIEKAKLGADEGNILFFQYSGDLSISADLSNELTYLFPDKIIVVIFTSGIKANVSVRGNKIKEMVLKSIEGLEGATGGGHENAVGAQVKIGGLEEFKERMRKEAG